MKLATTCPRCQERPSRRTLVNTSGRPALCRQCYASPNFEHRHGLRLPGRPRTSDRSASEIDRIYQAELAKMRQQRRRAS